MCKISTYLMTTWLFNFNFRALLNYTLIVPLCLLSSWLHLQVRSVLHFDVSKTKQTFHPVPFPLLHSLSQCIDSCHQVTKVRNPGITLDFSSFLLDSLLWLLGFCILSVVFPQTLSNYPFLSIPALPVLGQGSLFLLG